MVVGSFVEEYTSPFPPSKLWKASVIDANNLHPKVLPEIVASSEVIQRKRKVGTIREIHFTSAVKKFTFMKERIADREKQVLKYSVFKDAKASSQLRVTTNDGETLTEATMAGVGGLVKAVNDYLHANPGAYA